MKPRSIRACLVGALGLASLLAGHSTPPLLARPLAQDPPPQQPSVLKLDLMNPGVALKVGLPDFAPGQPDAELSDAGRAIADVLWADLDFEKEFYMIARKESASIPVAASPDQLAADRWSELGADIVLMGALERVGANLKATVRIVGVKGETARTVAWGYEYSGCTLPNPRACAHFIADHVHKELRRLDGVARTKLAFTSDRDSSRMTNRPTPEAGPGKEIYIADYDGANQQRLTVNRSLNISPRWSPDGRLIAYTSYSSGFPDILVANLGEPGRFPTRPAAGNDQVKNYLSAWSPDGSKLAFASTRSGNMDIWVVNRDGTNPRNLTNHAADDGAPTWSPTGAQIAFTSDRTGSNQVWVMTADGGAPFSLTSGAHADRPTWSPAPFNMIAYTCGAGPGHDICAVDIGTRRVTVLTDGLGDNQGPTFAPNGRHLAFYTTRWGKEQIAVIDINGRNLRRITDSGNNTYPNWSPSPGGK